MVSQLEKVEHIANIAGLNDCKLMARQLLSKYSLNISSPLQVDVSIRRNP